MLVAFISNLIAAGILYTNTKKTVENELKSKIISIVATTAAFIDIDLIKEFRKNPKEDDPNYLAIRKILQKALYANKRKDFVVSFLYLFQKPEANNDTIVVEVDTKTKEQRLEAGHQLVRPQTFLKKEEIEKIGEYNVTKNFYKNRFGIWLSAFAPTRDSNGEIIGYVGINVRGSNVVKYLQQILIYCLISMVLSLVAAFILAVILAKKFSDPLHSLCHTVDEIGNGNLLARCEYKEDDEFGNLGHEIDKMADGLEERERVKDLFTRYVSKDILELILKKEGITKLEGERKKVTVMFSDLRQFSKISETLPPEEVVKLLNNYFEKMIEIIFQYKGTLDKILGDGLMVLFGAPLEDEDQEMNAVNAAMKMQEALKNLCDEWQDKKRPYLKMGIGIHTGDAVVGNIGSERHLEYTAIGMTVNFAYRLEQATKQYQSPILLSSTAAQRIKNIPLKSLGRFNIKEKETNVEIFAIEGQYEHF